MESGEELILTDVVAAECVYVFESVYELTRDRIAFLIVTALGFPDITAPNESALLRAFELYAAGNDFVDSYLVASAEEGGAAVASFNKGIDRIGTVRRVGGT